MGYPVETNVLHDMHELQLFGDFDGPYPLIYISTYEDINVSVDTYNKERNLQVPNFIGGTHNPLYDSYAALIAYNDYRELDLNLDLTLLTQDIIEYDDNDFEL